MSKKPERRRVGKILLVEDEPSLRKGIRLNLEAEGYTVTDFTQADVALEAAMRPDEVFDLAIFDVMLPGKIDGVGLCQMLREKGYSFPVIFLTAKGRLEDKLQAFGAGGDDYLTKPFDLEELLARVSARLRRTGSPAAGGSRIGAFTVDLKGQCATSNSGGDIVRFSEKEIKILELLIRHRGRPVSRDEILDQVWGMDFPTNRTIDNFILKFRKIFEEDAQNPRYFITRHGKGYELSNEI